MSMKPGATMQPSASSRRAGLSAGPLRPPGPPRFGPMSTIRSPSTATSARYGAAPVPSTTVPPAITTRSIGSMAAAPYARRTIEQVHVTTSEGQFTASVAGPPDGDLVVLLHGFPQSRHSWRDQVPALGAAGYRAVTPDGRGYSPGFRPDPSGDGGLEAYSLPRLVADVLDIAGAGAGRFHLVGHDWGGQVAWCVAAAFPDRLASLTILSRPHPAAFAKAIRA